VREVRRFVHFGAGEARLCQRTQLLWE